MDVHHHFIRSLASTSFSFRKTIELRGKMLSIFHHQQNSITNEYARERCMDPLRKGEKEMENINQMTTCVMVKCASIDSSLFLFFNRKTTSSLHFRLYSSRSPFLSARFLFRSLNWVCSSFFIHLLIFILKFCYSIVFCCGCVCAGLRDRKCLEYWLCGFEKWK